MPFFDALRDAAARARVAAAFCVTVVTACAAQQPGAPPVPNADAAYAAAAPVGQTLYAYSPDGLGLVAAYPAGSYGLAAPLARLAGPNTRLSGGPDDFFGAESPSSRTARS